MELLTWFKEILDEDIGKGDITTEILFEEDFSAKANIIAKEDGIFAGGIFIEPLLKIIHSKIVVQLLKKEGESFSNGEILCSLKGSGKTLLSAERVCLNLIQRLSGVATLTRKFVEKAGERINILDTRKTTPGMRWFEKYAVRVGGGKNHRIDLSSGILIKDNHIHLIGSIKDAVKKAKKNAPLGMRVEVEVTSIDEAKEAIESGADILLLDNMEFDDIKRVLSFLRGKCLVEVSGGITLNNIEKFKKLPVDYISVGALTHSARSLDFTMKME